MNVFCLSAGEIDKHWPEFGHQLEKFESTRGTDYAADLKYDLKHARKQLWGAQDDSGILCVVVTRISDQPRGKVCEIYAAAGQGTEVVPCSSENVKAVVRRIETWAKEIGCTRMTVSGRKGWKRLLDYAEAGVILEKTL